MHNTLISLILSVLLMSCVDQSQNTSRSHGTVEKVLFDDIDSKVIYSHGPTKRMMAEQYLNSVAKLTGHDFGRYDFVTGDRQGAFRRLCENLGGCPDNVTRFRSQSVDIIVSLAINEIANIGCISDRKAISMIPPDVDESNRTPTDDEKLAAVRWQYIHFFGEAPDESEMNFSLKFINDHFNKVDPDTGLPSGETRTHNFGTALRGHCFALLTSSKFIYY